MGFARFASFRSTCGKKWADDAAVQRHLVERVGDAGHLHQVVVGRIEVAALFKDATVFGVGIEAGFHRVCLQRHQFT